MKTKVKTINVDRIGVAESTSFTIKASAKAFKILSDGLYSDKILAIIRELGCNAYDAHIDEGTSDKPFLIHLPNSLEPWFSIRDFGTGLSHEDVMHLYTTYFDSTKTDSNDYIGALGLGSKSPFSYVETFTVTSYFSGEQRTYIADLGEAGVPQISLLQGFPMKTTEPNGLEIKLAVEQNDFRDFEAKAKEIYKRFDPLPEVVGVAEFKIAPIKYALEGTGWRVIASGDRWDRKPYAIQGVVAYPIDRNAMRDLNNDQERVLDGLNIELDFEIGELDIAANREALGYDTRTSANIMKKVDVAIKEIGIELNKNFKACKTMWEAKALFHTTFGTDHYDPMRRLISSSKIAIMWRGKEVDHSKINGSTNENLSMTGFNVSNERSRYGSRVKSRRYGHNMNNDSIYITAGDDVIFFVDDLEKGGSVARMRHFVNELESNKIEVYMIRHKTKKALADLRSELGNPKFRLVSDLPKAPKVKRDGAVNSDARGNGYAWIGKSSKPTNQWSNTAVDFKAGGLYIPVHRCNALDKDGQVISSFGTVMENAFTVGILIDGNVHKVYGIPKGQISKLKGKWINVIDFIKKATVKKANDPAIRDGVGRAAMLNAFDTSVRRGMHVSDNLKIVAVSVKDKKSSFIKFSKDLVAAREGSVSDSLMYLTRHFDIEIKSTKQVDLVKGWETIIATYPMITWPLDTWGQLDDDAAQKVVDYVNLVNQK